ncbi:MAG: RnfABCDGE type electron transport complex subunit D [Defluviitaleaceae bacterium]|nr:RnfABCDGE type electron transport complex subunit D [Defluviitaleaceae bacterium]
MSDKKYVVTGTPHIRDNASISGIMMDVVIALLPATIAGIFFFGVQAGLVVLVSVAACVFFEWAYKKVTKQECTIGDFSALVTGLLLALNLPSTVPLWLPVVGAFIAIIVAKELFGGLGQNFINPALAGRAFLVAAYPVLMLDVPAPVRTIGAGQSTPMIDAVAEATPLEVLGRTDIMPHSADYLNAFIGNVPGMIGEVSAIALLLGGGYLLVKKIISWRIPVVFIATVALLTFVFGRQGLFTGLWLYEILLGGLMLGAFFMATDYSSSPVTHPGQIIMGLGCGVLTFAIRHYGGYPEGVAYSILIMNLFVPLIDKYTKPRVYGVSKKKEAKA